MTGSNTEAITGSMPNSESPDGYLDDLPGYESADPYRGRIQKIMGVEPAKLQPLEKGMIKEAVSRKFKKIMCVNLSKSVISEISDVIIKNIDEYQLTSVQVKDLILKTYSDFKGGIKYCGIEGAPTLFHTIVGGSALLGISVATLKPPKYYSYHLPEEKKKSLMSNIYKNANAISQQN